MGTLQALLAKGGDPTPVAMPKKVIPPVSGSSRKGPSKSEPLNPKKFQKSKTSDWDVIPITYTQLYPVLIQQKLVTPKGDTTPPPKSLPAWYDQKKHCEFHEGALGHDLEGCYALKLKVQNLIESNILSFKNDVPIVQVDFPVHAKDSTNPQDATMVAAEESSTTSEVALEEQLRAIKGKGACDMEKPDLCPTPDVVMPSRGKVPDFKEYKGSTHTMAHSTMYSQDDKPTEVFMKHYHDVTPTRTQLQNLAQGSTESFKEYAQRWRELAEKVQPSLPEEELVRMFMDTVQGSCWRKMMSCMSSSFSNLVIVGDCIESVLKGEKAQDTLNSQFGKEESPNDSQQIFNKKKRKIWGDSQTSPPVPLQNVAAVQSQQPWVNLRSKHHSQGYAYQNQRKPQNNLERRNAPLDPLPMTYGQLLPHLVQNSLVFPKALKTVPQSFTPEYDPNATCGYHAGSVGHSTDDCQAFKAKVQQLIDNRCLTLHEGRLLANGDPIPE